MANSDKHKRFRVGKTYLTITTPKDAVATIEQYIADKVTGYICVSNPRTVIIATRKEDYRTVMANSLMNIPDAEPDVWAARLWGLKEVERTMGPFLFRDMLFDKKSGLKHFLLGDTDETLKGIVDKLKEDTGDADNIVGIYSPPFCSLDEYDYEAMAKMIRESGADIVWLSLTAPKQDYMAARLSPMLPGKVCIGVGAAFRFYLGKYKMAPKIIKKLGLMGLYWGTKGRSLPDFCVYYWNSTVPYLWYLLKIPFRRMAGKKHYE